MPEQKIEIDESVFMSLAFARMAAENEMMRGRIRAMEKEIESLKAEPAGQKEN